MPVRIVRLGTPRTAHEGTRLGTVRRPPRGVPKSEFARRDFYDVWFPVLAPSAATLRLGINAVTDAQWKSFARKFRAEMATAAPSQSLDLLAALSHQGNFSMGCYCENEARCHRSLLRELLIARGARIA